MSKAPKKTAKKATKKVVKKTAAPAPAQVATAAAPAPTRPSAQEELSKLLSQKPATPQEATEQMTAMLRRLIGDTGRHEAQIQYMGRSVTETNMAIGEQLHYLEQCIRHLYAHEHLEMPKRQPMIVDATVVLVQESELAGEELDMRAAYTAKAHPVRGNYEIILGGETLPITKLHVKVVNRLIEAFEKKIADKSLVDGEFYYVRLNTIHAEPIGETSVQVDQNYQPVTQAAP